MIAKPTAPHIAVKLKINVSAGIKHSLIHSIYVIFYSLLSVLCPVPRTAGLKVVFNFFGSIFCSQIEENTERFSKVIKFPPFSTQDIRLDFLFLLC